MPWSSISDVPSNIKRLDGISLSLDQANHIASVADALKASGKGDSAWAIAISQFKKSHKIQGSSWVGDSVEDKSFTTVEKQADGSYWITAVSTAAVADREGETFTVDAMDYDLKEAEKNGDYPEFRVFHSKALGIGRVEKMTRAGIFAIDEGSSYQDAFSQEVCEKMLLNNNGKYRCSRGFRVVEAAGMCPQCGTDLVVKEDHFAGFRCPVCMSTRSKYKELKGLHYKKARTFDVTITDIPCVPMTGAGAKRKSIVEESMNKAELKQRLLKAGIPEDVVEDRLGDVSEEQLKQMDGIPFAEVLKEFQTEEKETDQVFTLDPEVLEDFTAIVRKEVAEAINGITIEIPDDEIVVKEVSGIAELKEKVDRLASMVERLLASDEERLKELLDETPRASKLRIKRAVYKSAPADDEESEDEEDDEMMEGEESSNAKKKMPPWMKKKQWQAQASDEDVLIVGADGVRAHSMTEFIGGGR